MHRVSVTESAEWSGEVTANVHIPTVFVGS